MENNSTGIFGSIISVSLATISIVSLQPWVTFLAGLLAIIASITTIYKNKKK